MKETEDNPVSEIQKEIEKVKEEAQKLITEEEQPKEKS